jgi:hypothetical protein
MAKNTGLFVDIGQGLYSLIGLPRISSWNTAGRPKNPNRGTFGFNYQTNNLEYWDGSYWFKALLSKD